MGGARHGRGATSIVRSLVRVLREIVKVWYEGGKDPSSVNVWSPFNTIDP